MAFRYRYLPRKHPASDVNTGSHTDARSAPAGNWIKSMLVMTTAERLSGAPFDVPVLDTDMSVVTVFDGSKHINVATGADADA
jgi:hypothetical protein